MRASHQLKPLRLRVATDKLGGQGIVAGNELAQVNGEQVAVAGHDFDDQP